MKKRRIVIASVLKPVDDTRMLEKMGMTLSESGMYDVFIIGYPSKAIPAYSNVSLLPLSSFSRLSLGRLMAPLKILKKINQVKPDVLVVNTHELLIVAIINKILFGTRIVYDVRENYFRNILCTEAFPVFVRPFLAACVRLKEILAAPWVGLFLLAERGYQVEINFARRRSAVIENKAMTKVIPERHPEPGKHRLLFSGTLAESTGAFQAIELAKKLHALDPAIQLNLVGYCAKPDLLNKIREAIAGLSFIQLQGGDQLVPHPEIMKAIASSNFGLVCYPPTRQNENSIPTKLYEYLACKLPILLQNHGPWVTLCEPWTACIPIDFKLFDPALVLNKMQQTFYQRSPEDVTWETEGTKLLAALDNIFT